MITGAIRSQVDKVWDAFWSGGVSNPKKKSDRKAKSFFVPVEEIRENKYDLSINRYKEIEYEEVVYEPPLVILDQLEALEKDIAKDFKQLRKMVS